MAPNSTDSRLWLEKMFDIWDFEEGRLPAWALGPLPDQDPANELPDTHRLGPRTRQCERSSRGWTPGFVSTWSSPELRRNTRWIYEDYHTMRGREPDFDRLDSVVTLILDEMRLRYLDPGRERRVVTERVQAAPSPPPQPKDVHLYEPAQDIHVQGSSRLQVQHVYEQTPPINVHVHRAPPVRVVHHQLPPRIIIHDGSSQVTTIQRSGAARSYERSAPEPEDIELRPRRLIEFKEDKEKKGKRHDSSDEKD